MQLAVGAGAAAAAQAEWCHRLCCWGAVLLGHKTDTVKLKELFNALSRVVHPDKGGCSREFDQLMQMRTQLLSCL